MRNHLRARRRGASVFVVLFAATTQLAAPASALVDPGLNPAESANYLRSRDGGDEFDPQNLDDRGEGVGAITQVSAEDGTVHALFSTSNQVEPDYVVPFDLYYRRSDNGGREFGTSVRLDDGVGNSSEESLAVDGDDVHVVFEEKRAEFVVDSDGDGVLTEDDDIPEEVFYTSSSNGGNDFDPPVNLSNTAFAQETDNDTVALGERVVVAHESKQIDDLADQAEMAGQATTSSDIVVRVSNDGGATFPLVHNVTFDGYDPFDTEPEQKQVSPKVGVNDDGVIVVAFRARSEDEDTARTGYVRSTDGGVSFGDFMVLPSDVNVDDAPSLYMDGDAVHVLACHEADPAILGDTNRLLHWNSTDAGATWSDPPATIFTGDPCSKSAVDGNGDDLHAAFSVKVAGEEDVFHISSSDAGVSWGEARNVSANHAPAEAAAISVDTDDSDDVHLTWQDTSLAKFSLKYGQDLPDADGEDRRYANEDVIEYKGSTFEVLLDGGDVGLRNLRIDAMATLPPAVPDGLTSYVLSFTERARIPGIEGKVDDSALVLFTPTSLGEDTAGEFSLFFDPAAVGLTRSAEDTDAVEVHAEGGDLYLSTNGTFTLEAFGDLTGDREDVFVCRDFTVDSCEGGVDVLFDGSARGLDTDRENVDAFAFVFDIPDDVNVVPVKAFFSTNGDFEAGAAAGEDHDLFSCALREVDKDVFADVSSCGDGIDAETALATTFIGEVNRIKEDIVAVDMRS